MVQGMLAAALLSVWPGKLGAMHVRARRWSPRRGWSWLGRAGGSAWLCIGPARSDDVMHMRTDLWTLGTATLYLRDSAVPGRAVLAAVQGLLQQYDLCDCLSLITYRSRLRAQPATAQIDYVL